MFHFGLCDIPAQSTLILHKICTQLNSAFPRSKDCFLPAPALKKAHQDKAGRRNQFSYTSKSMMLLHLCRSSCNDFSEDSGFSGKENEVLHGLLAINAVNKLGLFPQVAVDLAGNFF